MDFATGLITHQIRVVKPMDCYFVAGTAQLNPVGLAHLKSYVLQFLGVLKGVNTWSGIPVRAELRHIQYQKCQAWLKAHGVSNARDMLQQDQDEDTDVEDEVSPPVVLLRGTDEWVVHETQSGEQRSRSDSCGAHCMGVVAHVDMELRVSETQSNSVLSSSDDVGQPLRYNRFGVRVQPWDGNVEFDPTDPL